MDIWVVVHALYLSFIKVLGSWSEVPACEESSRLGWAGPGCGTNWCAASFSALTCGFFQLLSTMARRPRSSRAWHFVLSAARRDADARAVALAGTANWGYDSDGQVGSSG